MLCKTQEKTPECKPKTKQKILYVLTQGSGPLFTSASDSSRHIYSLQTSLGILTLQHMQKCKSLIIYMAASQCSQSCRHGQDDLLKFKMSMGMGGGSYISDNFECGNSCLCQISWSESQKMCLTKLLQLHDAIMLV